MIPTKAYIEKRGNKIVLFRFVNETARAVHCFHINTTHTNIRKWAMTCGHDIMNFMAFLRSR